MMNPVHRLVRQSKTMFALWEEERYLDPADRDLLARHCPRTEPIDAGAERCCATSGSAGC
jgi:hypothetical protein